MAITAAGTVVFDTDAIDENVRQVTIDKMVDIAETTSFDDATWKTFIAELKEFGGSMEMNWSDAHNHEVGDSGTLVATITSGPTFSGTVIITNIGMPMPKGKLMVSTVTFKGSGELSTT